jgi:sulfonate transport system substrate-binding protein
VIVNNLTGAIEALTKGDADLFMWEKFTTKPWVDNHTFRRIGECPTPWPCFVIAIRNDFLKKNKSDIHSLLSIINSITAGFKALPDAVKMISEKYQIKETDVAEWLKNVEWASDSSIEISEITKVTNTLLNLGIINSKKDPNELIFPLLWRL